MTAEKKNTQGEDLESGHVAALAASAVTTASRAIPYPLSPSLNDSDLMSPSVPISVAWARARRCAS